MADIINNEVAEENEYPICRADCSLEQRIEMIEAEVSLLGLRESLRRPLLGQSFVDFHEAIDQRSATLTIWQQERQ